MEPTVPMPKVEPGVYQGAPTGSQVKKSTPSVSPIRTMKGDAADAVKKQGETLVSIALAEQRKNERERLAAASASQSQPQNVSPAPRKTSRLVIVVIIILLLALSVLAYIFVLPKIPAIKIPNISIPSFGKPPTSEPLPVVPIVRPLAPSIIPAQSEKRFNISEKTPAQIFADISSEISLGVPAGTIKNLYFTEWVSGSSAEISLSRLLTFGNVQLPVTLARSLEKEFMAGFYGESNGGATPFLILKVSDYNTGLAGILDWESSLPHVFNSILGATFENEVLLNTKFRSIIILGKDARTLDSPFGSTLVYAFATPSTIVMAGSQTALEALLPLAAGR